MKNLELKSEAENIQLKSQLNLKNELLTEENRLL